MPKPKAVIQAMAWAAQRLATPGRGSSEASIGAEELLFELRTEAGAQFGCRPEQVVLTTSATHGLNIAVKSLVKRGQRTVISGMEHNAVVRPLYAAGAEISVARGALFDDKRLLEDFDRLLIPGTAACIVTYVSNVFGWILPVQAIADMCRDRAIPLVLDASQAAGVLPVNGETLNTAFIAMPGHKGLLGPQGTGLLICNWETRTLIEGGTGSVSRQIEMPEFLPDRLEAGTHNIPGAAGLLAGMRYIRTEGVDQIFRREQKLKRYLISQLQNIPGLQVFRGEKQSGVVSFRGEELDSVLLAEELANMGIALRAGLHCAPLAHETAGTLDSGTVRVSVGPQNQESDIKRLLEALDLCRRKQQRET